MAKGKKNVLRADKKPEDPAEDTVTSLTETKENKPANNKGCKGNVQTVLPSLRTPSKPRSPLSDSSSTLIQEGNDSDSTKPDMPRLKKVASEQHKHLDDLIKNGIEEGMQVKNIDGKGRGVFAVSGFKRGDFVVEYHGDLLDLAEAKIREAQYAEDPQTGCYMYYFQYQSKTYCVDATKETSRLGRLINHCKTGNCQTRLHPIDGTPHLILVASRDINAGEELLYDYGDRSKASILAHPWLKH
ncbi:lysine methyltransferase 5Ab [Neolamprologus brichardi]|uniref:lysine methyltransferase 5Ab n=1 Tax=Neolamprologus brichardi TaxID=32507 RepID=UPI0003EC0F66|nr:lysine methyltransferase 5Ab [Neolamprologus brichardi]